MYINIVYKLLKLLEFTTSAHATYINR